MLSPPLKILLTLELPRLCTLTRYQLLLMRVYRFSSYMCHAVKIINLLGEFCLAYRLSSEAWEYILELVNKFAIMPVFQAILSHCLC